MPTIDAAHAFALDVLRVKDKASLAALLQEACVLRAHMGCSWFALSHHIDFLAAPDRGVRIHNYSEDWACWFDERRLGLTDPVHRASQRSMAGFLWHDMARYDPACPTDVEILDEARRRRAHGVVQLLCGRFQD